MKRFNIIITLSATLGLFSCELDKMPMDQVSDAVFWQKPADGMSSVCKMHAFFAFKGLGYSVNTL